MAENKGSSSEHPTIAELRLWASTNKNARRWTKCWKSDKISWVGQDVWSRTKCLEWDKLFGVVQMSGVHKMLGVVPNIGCCTKYWVSYKMSGVVRDIGSQKICRESYKMWQESYKMWQESDKMLGVGQKGWESDKMPGVGQKVGRQTKCGDSNPPWHHYFTHGVPSMQS